MSSRAHPVAGVDLGSHDDPDVADLVWRSQAGERSAVAEAYDRHGDALRMFARRLLGDPAAAEDLVHDVFLVLPKTVRRFEGRSSLRTFLISVAANRCRHHVRAAARYRRAKERYAQQEDGGRPPGPSDFQELGETATRLARGLDELRLDQRLAFVLAVIETEAPSERGPESPVDATPEPVASGASSGGIETHVEPNLREPAAPSPVEEPGSTPSDGNRAAPRESDRRARRVARVPPATQGGEVALVPNDALDDALAELDSDADVRERRAFQDAHDVHFQRDYGEALRRWDRYLTSYPRGRFLPEARYNRAIALLRLSRLAQARTALSALASSRAGGGRRDDARRLLEAMDEGRLTVPGEPSAR